MKEELFPLIYVASSDAAGTALVERLIGSHPAIFSLGEVRSLPRARRTQTPCACGAELAACPFWSRAFAELDAKLEVAVEAQAMPRKPWVERLGEVTDLLLGSSSPRRIAAAKSHGTHSRAILESFRRTAQSLRSAEVRWILDASRDARRLLRLKDSRRFDLRVLHVVRDPRADVHAHLARMGSKRSLTRRGAARIAARWAFENLLLHRLASSGFRPEHVLQVRHEELVQDPGKALERIGQWLGLTFPSWSTRMVTQPRSHSVVPGGAGLLAEALTPEHRWREELPAELADTAWRVSWPVRAAMGYGRRRRAAASATAP